MKLPATPSNPCSTVEEFDGYIRVSPMKLPATPSNPDEQGVGPSSPYSRRLPMYRCSKCGQPWDDNRARDNELTCTRRCGGSLVLVEPLALPDLDGCDFDRLPYPVALTARRLTAALQA